MKVCKKCGDEKPFSSFSKDKYQKDGYKTACKTCCTASHAQWVAENTEKANEHATRSYHRRKEAVSQRRKELRQMDPEKYRQKAKETRLKNLAHYQRKGREASWKRAGIVGMNYERYSEMLEEQNHCCAICETPQTLLKKNLGVDHNHTTGEPRGLLCDACNRAIGYLKESKLFFQRAVNYLESYD